MSQKDDVTVIGSYETFYSNFTATTKRETNPNHFDK